MKIKKPNKRSDEDKTSKSEPNKKTKQITHQTQKRKAAKLHLEHTEEIKRSKELIKNKESQKRTLVQELKRANEVRWINADIIKSEINNIDNSIAKTMTWIKDLKSANQHIIKVLEIFNSEETTINIGSTGEQTVISDKNDKNNTISTLDIITLSSSEEDKELDQLVREAQAKKGLKTTTKVTPDHADTNANTKVTQGHADSNANTKVTPGHADTNADTNVDITDSPGPSKTTAYARGTGLTQSQRPPETTTPAFTEHDMKIINEKIVQYEKMFVKDRQETTVAEPTKDTAFYNHGQRKMQKERNERYPPPRINDCRKKKFKIAFYIEN